MFKSKPQHSYVDLFEGILIGGTLVAATTFLLGTKKGKQLQKELRHKYAEMKKKAEHVKHKVDKALHSKKAKRIKRKLKAKARTLVRRAKRTKSRR